MEKKTNLPPARKGKGISKKLKKIITFFTCIILIFVSVFIYSSQNFAFGYKYYETFETGTVTIGVTQEENLFTTTVQEILDQLENDGYYIISWEVNPDILMKSTVIKKSEINTKTIKQAIHDTIDVEVLLTKLNIDNNNNTYYFKTDEECKTFVSELNTISSIETTSEGITGNYKLVSKDQDLQLVKAELQKKVDAEKAAAEAARKREAAKVTSRGGYERGSGSYKVPMASYVYISSGYGQRHGKMHTGVDFAATQGTSIYAWKSGTITMAKWNGNYGNFIEIQHNDGTVSRYAHLSGYAVSAGQSVEAGTTIGYVGSTGNSTGPHLHFEIKVNGSFVNPLNYL